MVSRIRRNIRQDDPHRREYGVTVEISQQPIHSFMRPLGRESSERYLKDVGEVGTVLLRELFAIPGVSKVFITPYELTIDKGLAFNWDEIEPSIIEVLKRVFGETGQEIAVELLDIPADENVTEDEIGADYPPFARVVERWREADKSEEKEGESEGDEAETSSAEN